MVTNIKDYNEALRHVCLEMKYKVKNVPDKYREKFPPCNQVFDLDKPIHMLINSSEPTEIPTLQDKGDYYEHLYTYWGMPRKTYKDDFGWINDKDSVFFIERPFTNRVVRAIKSLLPDHSVHFIGNDIIVDDLKIGPTCPAGDIDYSLRTQAKNSGHIYLIRWSNPEALDEIFKGDPNHELRKTSEKRPIGCLSAFLPNMTRQEFIDYLENFN